jgi:hypothetical protein
MHLKLTNGTPEKYTLGKLRRDNPNTSFPKNMTEEFLAGYSVYKYIEDRPQYDSLTQRIVEDGFREVDGKWKLSYAVENLPQEEAEMSVRRKRDALLGKTDWMALSDVTMKDVWSSYRQQLRDLTSQVGFPYSVEWPVKPE